VLRLRLLSSANAGSGQARPGGQGESGLFGAGRRHPPRPPLGSQCRCRSPGSSTRNRTQGCKLQYLPKKNENFLVFLRKKRGAAGRRRIFTTDLISVAGGDIGVTFYALSSPHSNVVEVQNCQSVSQVDTGPIGGLLAGRSPCLRLASWSPLSSSPRHAINRRSVHSEAPTTL
jgi:hypothetical protein